MASPFLAGGIVLSLACGNGGFMAFRVPLPVMPSITLFVVPRSLWFAVWRILCMLLGSMFVLLGALLFIAPRIPSAVPESRPFVARGNLRFVVLGVARFMLCGVWSVPVRVCAASIDLTLVDRAAALKLTERLMV
jgi:hypothetical protein